MLSDLIVDPVALLMEGCHVARTTVRSPAVTSSWAPSCLEGLSVGALTAHLYSTLRLFERALEQPPPPPERPLRFPEFYGLNRVTEPAELDGDFHRAVRDNARSLAAAGPTALGQRFELLVARLGPTLQATAPDRLVGVWRIEGGATTFREYVLTRIVEVAVHLDDLAVSLGLPAGLPAPVVEAAATVCLDLACSRVGGMPVLRALTRRERGRGEDLLVL